jgi:hypothetical protein
MIKIEFPKNKISLRQRSGVNEVFDVIRKKWLQLSPEEWVRQNMIQYLIVNKYPATLMAIEKGIKLNELLKRCDIVIYDRNTKPFMIIECKEMNVTLSEKTLSQILRYQITLPAKYLIITNGSYCYGFEKHEGQFHEIDQFPAFQL